ncbi:amidohydrolase family protein [Streptomyces sp. NPDC058457]|uniref:amidohydrolase family protein n=1 Tax=Streptomyces sp. NPDC058457 TaxID=3346507 RepID=UPI0036656B99
MTQIVDAHHHLWDLAVRDQDWTREEALRPLRRSFLLSDFQRQAHAAGVTKTVVVQTVTVAEETPELLTLCAGSDLVAGVVGWTDLIAADVADRLHALKEGHGGTHLVGIRHQVQSEPDPDWLLRPAVQHGLRTVQDAGLVYDLVITPWQLPAAIRAAAALPDLVFVLDHLAKPPVATGQVDPWARHLRELARLPNVVAKLSGLVTEADWSRWTPQDLQPFMDIALEAFGVDRLMFGSDWPVCTLAADYDDVLSSARALTSDLSADERTALFAATATRVYRI